MFPARYGDEPMDAIQIDLVGIADADQRLQATIAELTDIDMATPSLLATWTVGHVLTHLARNAEGLARMIGAAARGAVGEMYPQGQAGRAADIERGARRSAAEIADDVRQTAAALHRAWAELSPESWHGYGNLLSGQRRIDDLPALRRRELEVHLVDLGLGPTWEQWPDEYVRRDLRAMTMLWSARRPMGMTTMPPAAQRAGDHRRLAWLLGRAEIDGLAPAGIYG